MKAMKTPNNALRLLIKNSNVEELGEIKSVKESLKGKKVILERFA